MNRDLHLSGWAERSERLAFGLLLVLALAFAFEIPLGGKLAGEATLTTVKSLEVVVIGAWIGSHILTRSWPSVPGPFRGPVALWLGALLISTLLVPDSFAHTIRFMSRVVQGILLAWIVFDLVNSRARWWAVFRCVTVGGLVVALLGLGEAARIPIILRFLLLFHDAQTHVGDVVRVSSSLIYATIAAMVLEMIIPLALAWLLATCRRWLKVVLMVGVGGACLAMVYTLTRSAVLGLVSAMIVAATLSLLDRRRAMALGALGTIGAVTASMGLLFASNSTVGLRMFSESENAWYQARYVVPAEVSARPNDLISVPVQVTNAGLRSWQAAANPPFRLGYSLVRPGDGAFKPLDGPRTGLPADVEAGQTVNIIAQVPVPEAPGTYVLQWDMVEETVLWFSWRGSPLGSTRLVVTGQPVASAPRPQLGPANHSTSAPPIDRPALWGAALRMFREKPLFGVGPDNFRWLYGHYLSLPNWDTNIHANSLYFEFLADTGLVGLLAFLWLAFQIVRWTWRGLRRQTERDLWIAQLALLSSLTAWFVHSLLDYFYEFTGTYILFWLIVGLAINRSVRDERDLS